VKQKISGKKFPFIHSKGENEKGFVIVTTLFPVSCQFSPFSISISKDNTPHDYFQVGSEERENNILDILPSLFHSFLFPCLIDQKGVFLSLGISGG